MRKLLKFVGILVVLAIVLVVGAIVVLPMVIDGDDIKAQLSKAAKEQTGRDLRIPGEVKLSVFPWLGASLGRIELGNAAGFSSDVFAATDKVDVHVKLMPLLSRKIEMSTVTVHGLTLNLERNKDGKSNWEDLAAGGGDAAASGGGDSSGGAPAVASLAIGGLDVRDATLNYRDDTSGQAFKVANLDFTTGRLVPGQPVDVELGFDLSSSNPPMTGRVTAGANVDVKPDQQLTTVSGLAVVADMKGDTLPGGATKATVKADAVMDGAKQTLTVSNLSVSALDLNATGAVTATGLDDKPALAGDLKVAPFDLRALLKALGSGNIETADAGVLGRAAMSATIGGSPDSVSLKPVTLTLDDSKLSGQVAVSNFAAPAIRFDLALDKMDLDRYLPPPAKGDGKKAAGAASPGAAAGAEAAGLPMDTLRGLNLVGGLKAGKIKVSNLNLSDLSAKIDARNGLIKLSPLAAKLYQGSYAGNIVLDARGKTPKLAVNETLSKVAIGPLLKDLNGKEPLSGTANLKAKLNAAGANEAAIKKSLNGNVSFQFLDGALNGVNIGKMIRDAKAKISGGSTGGDAPNRTDFAEITGTAKVTNEVINNQDLSAKSPLLRLQGKGTASLPAESIDYRATATVVATSKGQGGKELDDLSGVPIPVHITGSFADPKYSLDVAALGEALAKSKAKELVGKQTDKVKEKVEKKLGESLGDKAGKLLGGGDGDKGGAGGALKKLLGN